MFTVFMQFISCLTGGNPDGCVVFLTEHPAMVTIGTLVDLGIVIAAVVVRMIMFVHQVRTRSRREV